MKYDHLSKEELKQNLIELQQKYELLQTSYQKDISEKLADYLSQQSTHPSENENETQFKLLFERAPLGYQSLDINGNFIEVNQQWLDTLGYKRDEVIGKWFGDFLSPSYQDGFRKRFPIFKKRGKIHSEFEMVHKNGDKIFMAFEGRIGYDHKGEFKQTHCILQDITKKKKAEELLASSEAKYRKLFEYSPYGILIADEQSYYLDANESMCRMLGYSVEEITKLHARDIVAPSEIKNIDPALKKIKEKGDYEKHWTFKRKDGSLFEAEVKATMMPEGTRLAMVNDITERKKAENKLQRNEHVLKLFVEHSPAAIAMFDVNMNYIAASHRFNIDYRLGDTNLTGKSHYEVFPEIPEHWKAIHKRCLKGETLKSENEQFIRQDGTTDWIRWEIRPWYEPTQKIGGIILFSEVITERKKMEEELRREKEYLEAVFDSLSEGIVSCDANGVLTRFNKASKLFHGLPNKPIKADEWSSHYDLFKADGVTPMKKEDIPLFIALTKHEVKNVEMMVIPKNGTPRSFVANGKAILNEKGKVIGAVAAMHDITDRKNAEKIIIENERLLNTVGKISKVGGWEMDLLYNGKAKWTLETYRIVGIKPGDPIPGANEHIDWYLKEYRSMVQQKMQNLIKTGKPMQFEAKALTKDGKIKWVRVVGEAVMENGKVVKLRGTLQDISKQKDDEAKIHKNEEKLQSLFNNLSAGVIVHAPDTSIIFSNPQASVLLGLSEKQLRGKQAMDQAWKFLYEDHSTMHLSDFPVNQVLQSKKPIHNKLIGLHAPKKSGISWFLVNGFPVLDENKEVAEIIVTFVDITTRKIAEEQLKLSEKRFSMLMQQAPMVMEIYNMEGLQIAVNKAYESLWDFPASTTLNKFNVLKSKEVEKSGLMQYVKKAYNGESVVVPEYCFNSTGKTEAKGLGRVRWLSTKIYPLIDTEGIVTNIVISHEDVTERRLASEEVRKYAQRIQVLHEIDKALLAAQSPEEIANISLNEIKKLIPISLATVSTFDKEKSELCRIGIYTLHKLPHTLRQRTHLSKHTFVDLKLLEEGKLQIVKDLELKDPHSNLVKEEIRMGNKILVRVPLVAEGKLLGILSMAGKTMDDFTNERLEIAKEISNQLALSIKQWNMKQELIQYTAELEDRVKERTIQLEHTNQELREFAQIVSHDLKAPLRAISQLSYWISQDYADKIDAEGQKQLSMLTGRVKRLDNLIDGILQYSRAGRQREKDLPLSLQSVVEDCISLLDPPPNITIRFTNRLPDYVGDPTRLGQLFQNLINNAIKYMDKPQGIITISCVRKADFYEFCIADNGPGIEEKYFERIFLIFQRLVSRDQQEGTGVGLSLVKRIVQIYGGTIWLTSKIGEGSNFYFTLPVKTT